MRPDIYTTSPLKTTITVDDTFTPKPASSKPFYIVKRDGRGHQYEFLGPLSKPDGPWVRTITDTERFRNVRGAAIAVANAVKNDNVGVNIYRVTETPATESRTVISEGRGYDPKTTKFVIIQGAPSLYDFVVSKGRAGVSFTTLAKAPLYDTRMDAIAALLGNDLLNRTYDVLPVAVSQEAPEFTVEVLA